MPINVLVIETFADIYAQRLRAELDGVAIHTAQSAAEVAADLASIDVLVSFGISVNDDLVRRMTRLAWIQSLAAGVDHFLACPSLSPETIVTSARGIHGPAMRETVAFFMLSLAHNVPRLVRDQAAHRWDRSQPWSLLARKTVVLAGTGVSGSAVGELLQAFGMHVIGVSRTPRVEKGFHEMAHIDTLAEVVCRADYVVNVMPGGPQNAHLFGRQVLEAMKPSSYFINVGRGETVDEPALIDVLEKRRIAGAGLDVFATEPLPSDSRLWDLPNVFLQAHIGGRFDEYEDYVLPLIVDNMRLFLAGRSCEMLNRVPR
jgi:phosphoglycerate dehydrogenase-like enzyme